MPKMKFPIHSNIKKPPAKAITVRIRSDIGVAPHLGHCRAELAISCLHTRHGFKPIFLSSVNGVFDVYLPYHIREK